MSPQSTLTYVELARSAFGSMGATLSYVTGISASVGVCGSYLVFVAANLESLLLASSILHSFTQEENESDPKEFQKHLIWTVAMPIAVLLSSVRDAKLFAAVSFWGDVSVVAGMLAVLVYGLAATATAADGSSTRSGLGSSSRNGTTTTTTTSCVAVGSLDDMALAFGSIGYLFLVHFLVLPIESSMAAVDAGNENDGLDEIANSKEHNQSSQFTTGIHMHGAQHTSSSDTAANVHAHARVHARVHVHDHGHHKNRFQKVVIRTFAICGGIGGFFGIVGYLLFGADTKEIVLLNVQGGIGMTIVQCLLCVDLLLTYPVVMRPSIGVLEQQLSLFLRKRQQSRKLLESKRNGPCTIESDGSELTRYGTASVTIGNDNCTNSSSNDNDNNNNINTNGGFVLVEWKTHMMVCLILGGIAAGAATFVPAFGLLSGLVGGVSQTFLAFVLPPLMWAKQRETMAIARKGGGGRSKQDKDEECFDFHQCNSSNTNDDATGWSFLRLLPWRERTLVVCGFGLILWTLRTTWIDLN